MIHEIDEVCIRCDMLHVNFLNKRRYTAFKSHTQFNIIENHETILELFEIGCWIFGYPVSAAELLGCRIELK